MTASGESKLVMKTFSAKKIPGLDSLSGESYQSLNGELTPILHILFKKKEEEGTIPTHSVRRVVSPYIKLTKISTEKSCIDSSLYEYR